jgi:tetratricopeptide (TPR) repeat protein
LERAEAALMDGDYRRAASLAANASGPEAARIQGEALEAQGDLQGAAKAYARAAEAADDGAWLAKRAKVLAAAAEKAAEVTPTPQATKAATAVPTPTAAPTALPSPSSVPTVIPTEASTPVPTPMATQAPTDAPTAAVTAAPTPDAALEKERQALAKERQALEEEKSALEKKRKALDAGYEEEKLTQGLTLYAGGNAYFMSVIDHLNEAVKQDVGGGSQGPVPSIEFPFGQQVGLRWEGWSLEYLHLDQGLDYQASVSSGGQPGHAQIRLSMFGLGYDWAFVRRDGWLGPVELALPLRAYFGLLELRANGEVQESHPGGPAFGLAVRYWPSRRLLLELQGLYHIQPSGDNGGDNSDGNSCQSCSGAGSSNSGPSSSYNMSTDGLEIRLDLGWRFL